MTIAHENIPDANLHEPKGAAGATVGETYVADGAGSGSFGDLPAANVSIEDAGGLIAATNVEGALQELAPKIEYFNVRLDDISTAGFVLIPLPADGEVNSVRTVISGAIATADATLTVSRGGDAAILGTSVIPNSGSAEGDTVETALTTNNDVTKSTHNYLKIATDGASTNTIQAFVQIKMTV